MRFKLKTAWRYFLLGLVLSLILGGAALYFENGTYMQPPMVLYLLASVLSGFTAVATRFGQAYQDRSEMQLPRLGGFVTGFALPLCIFVLGAVIQRIGP